MDKKETKKRYGIILFTILVIIIILMFIPEVSGELKCGFIGLFVGVLYLWMAAYLKDRTSKREEQRNAMAIFMIFAFAFLLLTVGIADLLTQLGLMGKASMTQEPVVVVTEEPVATDIPTEALSEAPTETPAACVVLLSPENGADLPVTGKVTFSWTPLDGAERYVLNFILPSGQPVSFETDQTFRNRYMEAFVSGGEYRWQVVAQSADGSEVCLSEVFVFDKPPHE